MGTPLYSTDIIPLTSRPTLTVMDDGDYFVILDTSTGKISKILKTNIMTALKITYDNTSGLTADTVQAALDELVVNLGSSDSAILALAGRLDTLEGTGEGSVAKAIADLAGSGRTTETVKKNADDITDLAGTGRTTETVKGNADAIALKFDKSAVKSTPSATPLDTNALSEKYIVDNLALKMVTDDHESRISKLEFMPTITSWADVQRIIREGRASAYFPVGTQFEATWNGISVVWDVIGINHDKPSDPTYTRSLTIQANKILRTGRISGPEAMYNAVTELPAGTYIFTTNGLQYTFTSTQAVPVGGVIYIKTRSNYVPLTLTIYGANRTTVIQDNIAVTATTGVNNLTPINDHLRMRYGNNNYEISSLRQWLNSDSAAFAWQPLGLYDMPSSYSTQGFLNILDPDLKAVIGAVDKQVAKATSDGGGQSLFSDKVFLLSRKELFGDDEGSVTSEAQYAFWTGRTNADRIKTNLSNSIGNWWLRSPFVPNTVSTRIVLTGGTLSDSYAISAYGLAPACVIY